MNLNKVLIYFALASLVGCNKVKKSKRQLDGIWTIVSYQYTDPSGFSYFPEVSGKMYFENCESEACTYSMDIQYSDPAITGSRVEQGTYLLNEEANKFDLTSILPAGDTELKPNNEILFLRKNDLNFMYVENGRVHRYIFEK